MIVSDVRSFFIKNVIEEVNKDKIEKKSKKFDKDVRYKLPCLQIWKIS